jgi:hypothetical protein
MSLICRVPHRGPNAFIVDFSSPRQVQNAASTGADRSATAGRRMPVQENLASLGARNHILGLLVDRGCAYRRSGRAVEKPTGWRSANTVVLGHCLIVAPTARRHIVRPWPVSRDNRSDRSRGVATSYQTMANSSDEYRARLPADHRPSRSAIWSLEIVPFRKQVIVETSTKAKHFYLAGSVPDTATYLESLGADC